MTDKDSGEFCMKKIVTILALLAFGIPLLSFAQSPYNRSLDCVSEFNPFMSDINPLFQHKCVLEPFSDNKDEYCACLDKSSPFVTALSNNADIEGYKTAAREIYKSRLMGVYTQMNYGASQQENAFKMRKETDLQNGCSPDFIAEKFEKGFYDEADANSNVKGGEKIEPIQTLNDCNTEAECKGVFAAAKKRFEDYKQSDAYKALLETRRKIQVATANATCRFDDMFQFNEQQLKDLGEVKAFFEKYPDLVSDSTYIDDIQTMIETKKFCKSDGKNYVYDDIVEEYKQKSKILKDGKAVQVKSSSVLKVLNELKKTDEIILDKIEDNFKSSKMANACVKYDTFKVINSIPSDNLLNEWASKEPDVIANSLDPVNLVNNASSDSLKFIKSNPTLAKIITDPGLRKKLAVSLKNLAGTSAKKTNKPAKVKDYITFMQNDAALLVKENRLGDQYQCELLAKNFAAVSSSESVPDLDFMGQTGEMEDVANDLLACKVKKLNSTPDYQIDDVLAANQLYRIFSEDVSPEKFGPENDKEYVEYLKLNCEGYDELQKSRIKDNCNGRKRCIEKYAKANHRKTERLREKYYEKHPELKALEEVVSENTNSTDMRNISQVTNEKKQDPVVREYYEKVVRPRTKSSMYSTYNPHRSHDGLAASGKALAKAQEEFNSSVAPSQPEHSVAKTHHKQAEQTHHKSGVDEAIKDINAAVTQPSVNPGQVIPPFLNNPASTTAVPEVDKHKISDAEDIQDGLEDFNDLSTKEQASLIDQSKEYLSKQDSKNPVIADLQKKIADYDKKLTQKIHDLEKPAASRSIASNNLPTSVNSVESQNKIQHSPTVIGNNWAPTKFKAGSADKSAVSYDKALNQKYEKDGNSNGSDLIVVDNNSVFEFNNKPINKSEIKGDLQVSVPLEPSSEEFAKMYGNGDALKDYLAQNLKEVHEDQIISIKCKGDSCLQDKNEILLHISKDANNNLVIRSVDTLTQVRVSRMIDLNHTIEHETKSHKKN